MNSLDETTRIRILDEINVTLARLDLPVRASAVSLQNDGELAIALYGPEGDPMAAAHGRTPARAINDAIARAREWKT